MAALSPNEAGVSWRYPVLEVNVNPATQRKSFISLIHLFLDNSVA